MQGSSPNVELIRRVYELGRRYLEGDREPWDAAVPELFSPDVEVVPSSALASGTVGPYQGHEGIRRWIADIVGVWDQFEVRDERWLEVPPDKVLVLGTIVAGRPAQRGCEGRLDPDSFRRPGDRDARLRDSRPRPGRGGRAGRDQGFTARFA